MVELLCCRKSERSQNTVLRRALEAAKSVPRERRDKKEKKIWKIQMDGGRVMYLIFTFYNRTPDHADESEG